MADQAESPPRPDVEQFVGWRATVLSWSAWRRHGVFLLASICAGAGAWAFAYFGHHSNNHLDWAQEQWHGMLTVFSVPCFLVLITFLKSKYFPGTDGTGIPQAIAALKMPVDGPSRDGVLSLRILVGKIILTVLGLFSGASLGREGPSVRVGVCFMYLSAKFTKYPQHLMQSGLILAGGAAGIAAAFNAPIAGIVFSMEEIGRRFEKANASAIVRVAVVACIVNIIGLGYYLFYGDLGDNLKLTQWWHWLLTPAIGVAGGLLGGLFSQSLIWAWPKVSAALKARPLPTAAVLGLGIGLIGLLSGGDSLGTGYEDAKDMLIDGRQHDAFYPVARLGATFLTLLSGIPGGLFDPSLSAGASMGQLLGNFLQSSGHHIDTRAVMLLFMAAYFSGVVQSPITSVVILLEMTAAPQMALPMGISAIIAYEASHLVCRISLYEWLARNFLGTAAGTNSADDEDIAIKKRPQVAPE